LIRRSVSYRELIGADGSEPARLIPVCHHPEVPDVGAITLRNLDDNGTWCFPETGSAVAQRLFADVERVG
jgi:hypothetical protein